MPLKPEDLAGVEQVTDDPKDDTDMKIGEILGEAAEMIEKRVKEAGLGEMMDAVILARFDQITVVRGAIAMRPNDDLPRTLEFLLDNLQILAQEAGGTVQVHRVAVGDVPKEKLL